MAGDMAGVESARREHEYDAVIFDLDGVLIEGAATPAKVYQNAANDVIDYFGVTVSDEQRQTLGQYHYDETMVACCEQLGLEPHEFWAARERFASRRANRRLQGGARAPYPDTDVLEDLPVPLGIVSNNRDATVRFVADHLFPGTFTSARGRDRTVDGFRRRKPDSYYLDAVVEELGVDNALYVGDRETDVIAAEKANIDAAFLRREHNGRIRLDRSPAVDIESLTALRDLFAED